MKTQRKIWMGPAIVLIAASLILASCRKKQEEIPDEEEDTEQGTATDNNMAESMVNDIEGIGSEVSENSILVSYKLTGGAELTGDAGLASSPCATVILAPGTRIFTVDFGSAGCTGYDGRVRKGKLIFDFSASSPTTAVYYRNPGFAMNVTSQNYEVDGFKVNITNKSVTNTTPLTLPSGIMPGTNLTWLVSANVTIVKPNSGGTITWTCSRTKELVNTSDTTCYKGQFVPINWNKAVVKLNGNASGINAKGENYTAVATNLIRDFNCSPDILRPKRHPFVSGTVLYTPGNRPQRLIDFGSATSCDLSATVTIKNKTFTITLN